MGRICVRRDVRPLQYIPVSLKLVLVNEKTAPSLRGGFLLWNSMHIFAPVIKYSIFLSKQFFKNYQNMKQLFILSFTLIVIYSCSNSDKPASRIPDYPASPVAVKEAIKGKTFSTTEVAYISPFAMDKENPYEWMDGTKDSSINTLSFRNERLKMKMKFVSDSIVSVTDDNKTIEAGYRFDTVAGPAKRGNIVLLLSVPDSSINFPGMTGPVMMTYTYNVHGADDKRLFLETPRSYNNLKVLVMLKAD
jgi:hypothetical protein